MARAGDFRRGTTGIGYALMVGLVAVLALVAITSLGGATRQLFSGVGNRLSGTGNLTATGGGGTGGGGGSGNADDSPVLRSCLARQQAGYGASGVFQIDADEAGPMPPFQAYCEQGANGGGWTVFQRNVGGQSFQQNYAAYQAGFGSASASHWLGLDRLAALSATPGQLRVELIDPNGQTGSAQYSSFQVGNAASGHLLSLGGYQKSPVGDSLATNVGRPFSTPDVDRDESPTLNCASLYKTGFWFNNCHTSNPNGDITDTTTYAMSTVWRTWRGFYTPLQTRMMFRESGALEPALVSGAPSWVSNNANVSGLQAGVPFSVQLQATDPDGDALTYSIDNDAPTTAVCPCYRWVSLTPTGLLSGTPTSGSYRIRIGVTDNKGNYVMQTFTGTVP